MFCPNCGAKNEENAKFCGECGTPLQMNEPAGQPAADPENAWADVRPQEDPENPAEDGGVQVRPENPESGAQPQPDLKNSEEASGAQVDPGNGGMPAGAQADPWMQGGDPNQGRYQAGDPNPGGYQAGGIQGQPYGPGYGPGYAPGGPQYPPKVKKPRRPIPKAAVVIAAEVIAAVGLIVGIAKVMGDRYSPETVAMSYWKATAACQWAAAYDYCEFPESELLTKQMYVNANANNTEPVSYKSARAVDLQESVSAAADQLGELSGFLGDMAEAAGEAQESISEDVKNYTIEYMTVGSSDTQYAYLTLSRTGRKHFLFWDEWKVTSSDSWYQNLQFEIPENASLSLNGITVEASGYEVNQEEVSEGQKYISVPYLFTGTYQMEVTEEGMEPYRKLITVNSYGCEDTYVRLVPSMETVDAVAAQVGPAVKQIMESALSGADYSQVEALFSQNPQYNDDNYFRDEYQELTKDLSAEMLSAGSDSGIVSLQLSNIVSRVNEVSGDMISFETVIDVAETYRRSWSSVPGEDEYTISSYVNFVKEDGAWKLASMPVDSYDF